MARAFFDEAAEALRGFLPRDLRAFRHGTSARNLKVWYASWHEHYEVQQLSRTVLRAGGFKDLPEALEIGFHAEHPRPAHNDVALDLARTSKKTLGKSAVAGPFIGRRDVAERWRRLSELWDGSYEDDGAAIEAAERLSIYIRALEPVLRRTDTPACTCWSAR